MNFETISVNKLVLLILLMYTGKTFALSSQEQIILDLLNQDEMISIVVSKIDQLIQKKPNCNTVIFLNSILNDYPNKKKLIIRISRQFGKLKCEEKEKILQTKLQLLSKNLFIEKEVSKLLKESTNLIKKTLSNFELRVQKGLGALSGLRANISPSGRYLSMGGVSEKGSLAVWDRTNNYHINSLSGEHFTFLSAFYNDHFLFTSSPIAINLWDFIKNKSYPLLFHLGFPTFIELSHNRKKLLINSKNGDLRVYNIIEQSIESGESPITLEQSLIISNLKIQTGKFISTDKLLLGTSDGKILFYDLVKKKVISSLFIGYNNDLLQVVSGDWLYEVSKTMHKSFKGVREIAVSVDTKKYAILMNNKVVLIESNQNNKLTLLASIKKTEVVAAFFSNNNFILLSDNQLFYYTLDGKKLVSTVSLKHIFGDLTSALKINHSTVLLIGTDLLLYNVNQQKILDYLPSKSNLSLKYNTTLLDGRNSILLYTQENGLRQISQNSILERIQGKGSLFKLLYRGELTQKQPSELLYGLDIYQSYLYWFEVSLKGAPENRKVWFNYISSRGIINIIELPFNSSFLDDIGVSLKQQLNKKFRENKRKSDMYGMMKIIAPELKEFNTISFNGRFIAFYDKGTVKLYSLDTKKIIILTYTNEKPRILFNPANENTLVIADNHKVELWDINQKIKKQSFKYTFTENIKQLKFDLQGKYLVILSKNQFYIFDLEKNKKILMRNIQKGIFSAISFSPDSNRFIASGLDLDDNGAILLLADLKIMAIKAYYANKDTVFLNTPFGGDISFWGDSDHFMATSLATPEINIYKIMKNNLKKELSMLFLDEGEAIIYDPSGYYWSSLEAEKYITLHSNSGISRINQVKNNLYNKEYISAIMENNLKSNSSLKKPEFFQPPTITLLEPQIDFNTILSVDKNHLAMKLKIRSYSGKVSAIESISVFVNGTKIKTISPSQKIINVDIKFPHSGYNQLHFIVTDNKKNTSAPLIYKVHIKEETNIIPPKLYFLGIGSEAKNQQKDFPLLKYPYKDAKLIASKFNKMEKGLYWSEVITEVIPRKKITSNGIKNALSNLIPKLKSNDLLVIYVSGHGQRNEITGEAEFITNEGRLSWKNIEQWVAMIQARVLILLDACQSGDIGTQGVSLDNDTLAADLINSRKSGILVFSATRSWQNTYELPIEKYNGSSIFATSIAQAFKANSDLDMNGIISLKEFQHSVSFKAAQISKELFLKYAKDFREKNKSNLKNLEEFNNIIKIPHTPWIPNIELFGDIPLIPLVK